MEGSLEGSHGDRVREGDGVGDRGGLHHYQGLNSALRRHNQLIASSQWDEITQTLAEGPT